VRAKWASEARATKRSCYWTCKCREPTDYKSRAVTFTS
jgi:hypothetical protein